MLFRIFACATLLAATFVIADRADAQGRGMSGMSGMSGGFGSSGMSGFGGGGFGNSGFGNSGFGSSGFGSSGFGNSGFGSGGFGSGGFGNSGSGRSGFGNSGFGNSGFGGGQYGGGGQNFVGRDATDMQATFGQASRAQTQFFNNMNRQMSRNNRNRNQQKTHSNSSQPIRMDVKAAFTATRPSNTVLAEQLRTRIAKIATTHHMTLPLLTMQGDTAVLSGAATSDSERMVIGQLVAMEPGVREVRNLMTVAGEPSDIEPPPGS
jgi:hypothetical protein